MKRLRLVFGALIVTLGAVLALSGCGEIEADCVSDEECADDEICYNPGGEHYEPETCIDTCDPEAEDPCLEGEECAERDDGVPTDDHICLPVEEQECTSDDDCDEHYYCDIEEDEEEGVCEHTGGECMVGEDDQCAEGFVCHPVDDADDDNGNDDDNDNNDDNGNDDDNGNNDDNGEEYDGVCTHPDDLPNYYTVLIEDATAQEGDDDRCTDETYDWETAGAKIFDVVLLDGDEVVGHGVFSDYVDGINQNLSSVTNAEDIFDGEDPDYTDEGYGICPDWDEDMERFDGTDNASTFSFNNLVALGCAEETDDGDFEDPGFLAVYFEDDDGEPVALEDDHEVEVYAYGVQCSLDYADNHVDWGDDFDDCDDVDNAGGYCPQSDSDPYYVDICTDQTDDGQLDVASCDTPLETTGGDFYGTETTGFDVTLPY